MDVSNKPITIPAITLQVLLGVGSIESASFRRSPIEHLWPCGCRAALRFDSAEDVNWTPCAMHTPQKSATRQ